MLYMYLKAVEVDLKSSHHIYKNMITMWGYERINKFIACYFAICTHIRNHLNLYNDIRQLHLSKAWKKRWVTYFLVFINYHIKKQKEIGKS